jgi:hypothetical protein
MLSEFYVTFTFLANTTAIAVHLLNCLLHHYTAVIFLWLKLPLFQYLSKEVTFCLEFNQSLHFTVSKR